MIERYSRYFPYLLLGVGVFWCIFLRVYDLGVNPKFYTDAGDHLFIAHSLLQGEPNFYGLKYMFIPKPPLFDYLLAVGIWMFGVDIMVIRGLSVILSVATCVPIYLIALRLGDRKLGIVAVFLFAMLPPFVLYPRWGFGDYTLMGLFIVWSFWMVLKGFETRNQNWFGWSIALLCLSAMTNYYTLVFCFALFLVFTYQRKIAGTLFLIPIVATITVWLTMILNYGDIFLSEFFAVGLRGGFAGSMLPLNMFHWFTWTPLLLPAFIWMFLRLKLRVDTTEKYRFFLSVFLVWWILTMATVWVAARGSYSTSHLFPFMVLILALPFYDLARSFKTGWIGKVAVGTLLPIIVLAAFTGVTVSEINCTTRGVFYGFQTGSDVISVQNPFDARTVSTWLLDHTTPEDTVVVSSSYAWLLLKDESHPKIVDWVKACYPYNNPWEPPLPPDSPRILYPVNIENARFAVTDKFTANWISSYINPELIQKVEDEWRPRWQIGEFTIYENPNR